MDSAPPICCGSAGCGCHGPGGGCGASAAGATGPCAGESHDRGKKGVPWLSSVLPSGYSTMGHGKWPIYREFAPLKVVIFHYTVMFNYPRGSDCCFLLLSQVFGKLTTVSSCGSVESGIHEVRLQYLNMRRILGSRAPLQPEANTTNPRIHSGWQGVVGGKRSSGKKVVSFLYGFVRVDEVCWIELCTTRNPLWLASIAMVSVLLLAVVGCHWHHQSQTEIKHGFPTIPAQALRPAQSGRSSLKSWRCWWLRLPECVLT